MRDVYVQFTQKSSGVQKFVRTLSGLSGDFEFISGFRIMDARSIMGIFSLDLTKPVQLRIYDDNDETLEKLKDFITEDINEK